MLDIGKVEVKKQINSTKTKLWNEISIKKGSAYYGADIRNTKCIKNYQVQMKSLLQNVCMEPTNCIYSS